MSANLVLHPRLIPAKRFPALFVAARVRTHDLVLQHMMRCVVLAASAGATQLTRVQFPLVVCDVRLQMRSQLVVEVKRLAALIAHELLCALVVYHVMPLGILRNCKQSSASAARMHPRSVGAHVCHNARVTREHFLANVTLKRTIVLIDVMLQGDFLVKRTVTQSTGIRPLAVRALRMGDLMRLAAEAFRAALECARNRRVHLRWFSVADVAEIAAADVAGGTLLAERFERNRIDYCSSVVSRWCSSSSSSSCQRGCHRSCCRWNVIGAIIAIIRHIIIVARLNGNDWRLWRFHHRNVTVVIAARPHRLRRRHHRNVTVAVVIAIAARDHQLLQRPSAILSDVLQQFAALRERLATRLAAHHESLIDGGHVTMDGRAQHVPIVRVAHIVGHALLQIFQMTHVEGVQHNGQQLAVEHRQPGGVPATPATGVLDAHQQFGAHALPPVSPDVRVGFAVAAVQRHGAVNALPEGWSANGVGVGELQREARRVVGEDQVLLLVVGDDQIGLCVQTVSEDFKMDGYLILLTSFGFGFAILLARYILKKNQARLFINSQTRKLRNCGLNKIKTKHFYRTLVTFFNCGSRPCYHINLVLLLCTFKTFTIRVVVVK